MIMMTIDVDRCPPTNHELMLPPLGLKYRVKGLARLTDCVSADQLRQGTAVQHRCLQQRQMEW